MHGVEAQTQLRKVIKFIPFKTLTMDLEAILSELARIYFNRNNADMVELIALADAELYPVGSFDLAAERYEYTLKLAVPVKFFNHLKSDIDHLRHQLFRDISAITAPYIHEFISEVFLVIRIDQDPRWREQVLGYVEKNRLGDERITGQIAMVLLHAPADADGCVRELAEGFTAAGFATTTRSLELPKDKELRHVLHDVEKTREYGVVIVSKAFFGLPLTQESKDLLTSYITDPGKRFCQLWDKVSRVDVAEFSPGMARNLAYTTERMTIEQITDYILDLFALRRPEL